MMTPCEHPILKYWLAGTTCHRPHIHRSVIFENADFIVLKHNSHASYCDRFTGVLNCGAYAALYRKVDIAPDAKGYNQNLFTGYGELKRWVGRITKQCVKSDCETMGIHFDDPVDASVVAAKGQTT